MKREFVEIPIFSVLLEQIGDLELKRKIENEILKKPDAGDLIKGGSGIRKIRIGKQNKGKSGGYRVIYLDLPDYSTTYLLLIYDKSDAENISPSQKKTIKELIQDIKNGHKKKNKCIKR